MSEHEWCQDVPRDEAVRAAEDAAAVPSIQHRDLPEQVALLWASLGDILGRVVRLEGEMDAGQAEEAAPAVCDPASPVEGFRTERVTLEIVQQETQGYTPVRSWPWDEILEDWGLDRRGELARVVEETHFDDLANVAAERDAARADAERLRARVAELEAAKGAGEAKQDPVAWGVLSAGEITQVSLLQWRDSSVSWSQRSGGTVVPLYARSSPPRVKVPKELQLVEARGVRIVYDAAAVKKAIRAAGGEVEG